MHYKECRGCSLPPIQDSSKVELHRVGEVSFCTIAMPIPVRVLLSSPPEREGTFEGQILFAKLGGKLRVEIRVVPSASWIKG